MAPLPTKLTTDGGPVVRFALCLASVLPIAGCTLIGYEAADAMDASDPPEDAGAGSDAGLASDSGPASDADPSAEGGPAEDASDGSWNDASDGSTEPDASTDAGDGGTLDGAMLDASDAAPPAEGGLNDAALDGAVDAGADSSTDAAALPCDGGTCVPRCNLTGTFALKLTVPATWPGTNQINSGSGTFEFRFRLRANHVDNAVTVQLQQCGQTVPVVQAALVNENSLFGFPDNLFDREVLPGASAIMTLGDSSPSSSLSLPPVAMELGVKLNDPLNDAWPNTPSGLSSAVRVDVDGDGNPAVTGLYSNAGSYVYPRTSTSLLPQRAQQAHIAIRRVFSMTGTLMSCDASQGRVNVSRLDSHILGCRHADGSSCSTNEANNLDNGLPRYQLSAGSYVLSRVADGASCSAVRALP